MPSCWARSFSASASVLGMSSDAMAVCVRESQDWKSSSSRRNCCSLLASPRDASRFRKVSFISSQTAVISASRPVMALAWSGCSPAKRSASPRRSPSLVSMAARSRSMPVSLRWRAITPVRSLPSSLGGLDDFGFLADPGFGLVTVQVVVLHAQSRVGRALSSGPPGRGTDSTCGWETGCSLTCGTSWLSASVDMLNVSTEGSWPAWPRKSRMVKLVKLCSMSRERS